MLCLQVGLLKDALTKAGLPLYLAPYGVLPTAYECGIIEVTASYDPLFLCANIGQGRTSVLMCPEIDSGLFRHI